VSKKGVQNKLKKQKAPADIKAEDIFERE